MEGGEGWTERQDVVQEKQMKICEKRNEKALKNAAPNPNFPTTAVVFHTCLMFHAVVKALIPLINGMFWSFAMRTPTTCGTWCAVKKT